MSTHRTIDRCLIVGAGMTGLTAARALQGNGVVPMILEKSPGPGGRMATRREDDGGVFDHGAQFLTAREPRFVKRVEKWEAAGILREWCRGFPSDTGPRLCDGHVRYKVPGGMSALANFLANGIEVQRQTRATSLRAADGRWRVETEGGEAFEADAVIVTPPAPQALELLKTSNLKPAATVIDALAAIVYDPCIVLLAALSGPSAVPEPGGIRFATGPVAFLADNHQKGVSPRVGCVTIQSSGEFAREHWAAADDVVVTQLLEAAREWVDPSWVRTTQIKRWRYSMPLELYPEPCLAAVADPPLILAGDAFGGPRIEGAALSGLAAAEFLLGARRRGRVPEGYPRHPRNLRFPLSLSRGPATPWFLPSPRSPRFRSSLPAIAPRPFWSFSASGVKLDLSADGGIGLFSLGV